MSLRLLWVVPMLAACSGVDCPAIDCSPTILVRSAVTFPSGTKLCFAEVCSTARSSDVELSIQLHGVTKRSRGLVKLELPSNTLSAEVTVEKGNGTCAYCEGAILSLVDGQLRLDEVVKGVDMPTRSSAPRRAAIEPSMSPRFSETSSRAFQYQPAASSDTPSMPISSATARSGLPRPRV